METGEYQVARAAFAASAGPEERDQELLDMAPHELIAYVGQNPHEARRVFMLERAGQKRAGVLRATGIEDLDAGEYPADPNTALVNPTGVAPSRLGGA